MEKTKGYNEIVIDNPKFRLPNYRVYKHNDLIQCKSNFSVMEHRIIVLALAQIGKHDENLKMYRINIRDVLGKEHTSNYELVRNAVRKLHKSTIDMEESDGWKSYSFITKAQGKYRTNYIEIQFHEDIQKFLLGLKSHYTFYTLENVMNFKRNYSLRIYELCKQYAKIGSRTIKMDYLRTLFCLEDKYELFASFKDRVLNPAVREINKFSDIHVGFTEKRDGKKVVSIYFTVHRTRKSLGDRKGKTLVEVDVEIENTRKLETLGFDDDETWEFRNKYKEDRISCVLDLFEKNIDEIKFPKPWIEKALIENYVDNSAYKKQLVKKEERLGYLSKKLLEISTKKRELRSIHERIWIIKDDIELYTKTGELKPGDIMRFPGDYTIKDAIEDLENRIEEENLLIGTIQKELEILQEEADSLN